MKHQFSRDDVTRRGGFGKQFLVKELLRKETDWQTELDDHDRYYQSLQSTSHKLKRRLDAYNDFRRMRELQNIALTEPNHDRRLQIDQQTLAAKHRVLAMLDSTTPEIEFAYLEHGDAIEWASTLHATRFALARAKRENEKLRRVLQNVHEELIALDPDQHFRESRNVG